MDGEHRDQLLADGCGFVVTDEETTTKADRAWDAKVRDETPAQRLDRNWTELMQEIRVVQTGVQLLTGFLLTLPFQQRFTELTHLQKWLYLAPFACRSVPPRSCRRP